jgi:hypothetical protein
MAEFIRKGTKGAAAGKGIVGTVTKAEGLVIGGDMVDTSILKADMPSDLDGLIAGINDSHRTAVGQVGRAIIAAGRAGQLLIAAKDKIPKGKAFTTWLAETFEFSQRTAYDYMDVAVKLVSCAPEIENCKSIRDVLALCEPGKPAKKKRRDPKVPTFVTHLAKVEVIFREEEEKSGPIEDWDPEKRRIHAKMFDGVVRLQSRLLSGLT